MRSEDYPMHFLRKEPLALHLSPEVIERLKKRHAPQATARGWLKAVPFKHATMGIYSNGIFTVAVYVTLRQVHVGCSKRKADETQGFAQGFALGIKIAMKRALGAALHALEFELEEKGQFKSHPLGDEATRRIEENVSNIYALADAAHDELRRLEIREAIKRFQDDDNPTRPM